MIPPNDKLIKERICNNILVKCRKRQKWNTSSAYEEVIITERYSIWFASKRNAMNNSCAVAPAFKKTTNSTSISC